MQYDLPDLEDPQALRKVYQNVTIQKLEIDPNLDNSTEPSDLDPTSVKSEEPA